MFKVRTDIPFFSIAELIKLAKIFEMDDLKNQLEKVRYLDLP